VTIIRRFANPASRFVARSSRFAASLPLIRGTFVTFGFTESSRMGWQLHADQAILTRESQERSG
jgi:hypothetical protein